MLNKLETWHLRVCLGAVALMLTVPFLVTHHYEPIPSFYEEWLAIALGFPVIAILLRNAGKGPWDIPEIALLPLGLMLIAALQWLFLADALADRQLVFGCYMGWTALLVVSGRLLAREAGLGFLARVMAGAILVGALLEAISGLIQLTGMAHLPWVFPLPPGASVAAGNVAQPNNFADYLWLGTASVLYLKSRGWLNRPATVVCLAVLLPTALLSGSRSVWLYGSCLALLSWLWGRGPGDNGARTLRNWSIGALVASGLLQAGFSTGLIPLPDGIITSGSRLSSHGSYDPIRLVLWRVAFDAFLENPLLGVGFGQYTRHFHQHVLDLMPLRLPGLPEHAHNVFLSLLAELGLAAAALALFLGGRWIIRLARAPRSPEIWWIAACTAVLGIHSSLEYPLWYGFFLGMAALLAGAGSQSHYSLQAGRPFSYAIMTLLILGCVPLYSAYRDYGLLELAYNGSEAFRSAVEYRIQAQRIVGHLGREPSMLRSHVDLVAATLMADNGEALPSKLKNCDRAQRFSAGQDIVFKCAHLLALAGREDDSRIALQRAVAAYPDRAELVLEQWRRRSPYEPAIAYLVANFPPVAKARLSDQGL